MCHQDDLESGSNLRAHALVFAALAHGCRELHPQAPLQALLCCTRTHLSCKLPIWNKLRGVACSGLLSPWFKMWEGLDSGWLFILK